MSLEQEIKLQVIMDDEIALSRITWLSDIANGGVEANQLISTYFDTPDLQLLNRGIGLRLRRSSDKWFQTVKTSGTVNNGLHQRDEWEWEIAAEEFDVEKLKQTPLASIINDPKIWPYLKTIFITDFVRQTLQLNLQNSTRIELAYDRGEVRIDDKRKIIHEIELELQAGSIDELSKLATKLCKFLPVERSDESKAKAGYKMLKDKVFL